MVKDTIVETLMSMIKHLFDEHTTINIVMGCIGIIILVFDCFLLFNKRVPRNIKRITSNISLSIIYVCRIFTILVSDEINYSDIALYTVILIIFFGWTISDLIKVIKKWHKSSENNQTEQQSNDNNIIEA